MLALRILQRAVSLPRRCSLALTISLRSPAGRISKIAPYFTAGCCDMLNRMIHVACLKHKNAAELFFGFDIGTVGSRNFAVLQYKVSAVSRG
jgi:hypothetical protein